MPTFDPTRPPPGRLARLGVVVPVGAPDAQVIARFCDRAGIDVVWVAAADRSLDADRGAIAATATAVAGQLVTTRLGVFGDGAPDAVAHERVDVTGAPRPPAVATRPNVRWSAVAWAPGDLGRLLPVVDDVVLPAWAWPDLESAADEARDEAGDVGRDPATLGVAVVVPVSVGRTEAEAAVRADADERFRELGHPRDIGIFGTLEECQDRVIALAHAGVTDLRCILPAAPDVHDVIAQLTAVTIGTTDVLVPGSLRSPAPPPPEGWGGRPDQPPRQGVSGGSRRR